MAPGPTKGFVPVPGTTWELGFPLTRGPVLAEMHLSGLGSELPAEQSAEESLFGGGEVDAIPLPVCPFSHGQTPWLPSPDLFAGHCFQ